MTRKKLLLGVTLLLSLCCCETVLSQQTLYQSSTSNSFDEAKALFQFGRYSAAADLFQQVLAHSKDSMYHEEAFYFEGLCAKFLKRPNTVWLLWKTVNNHPAGIYAQPALFHLGDWYFHKNEFRNCWNHLQQIDALLLPDSLLHLFYFEGGYAQMKLKKPTGAGEWFNKAADFSGPYQIASNYYHAYMLTQSGKSKQALGYLSHCYSDPHFGPPAIDLAAQCYYNEGQYEEVIKLVEKEKLSKGLPQVVRLGGLSAFKLGKYDKTIQWIGSLADQGKITNDSDYYALGISYLKSDQYNQAIFPLEKVAIQKNALGQNASYNLAWAFLKADKKDNARLAFYTASQQNYDKQIQEESAFQYGKITYELLPNNAVSLVALQQYIDLYPKSIHFDEASDLLGGLLLNTHRYKEALKIMEGMNVKTTAIKTIIQKSAFCLGEQYYMDNKDADAEKYFKKSLEYPLDPKFKALAGFWLGEVDYREGNYKEAIQHFEEFINTPEAKSNIHYSDCQYNLGYCYFRQKKYKEAIPWFEQFVGNESFFGKKPDMVTDARLRLADALFCEKNYAKALDAYTYLIEKNIPSTDYALFQKGIIHGLLNMPHDKISTLEKLVEFYPGSIYTDEALFEMGYTAFEIGKLDQAIDFFDELINKYPNSRNLKRAHLNIGLIFYNQDQDQKAIEQLKYVVAQFPKTDEAGEALDALEEIYVAQGNVQEFIDFTNSVGKTQIKASLQDSLMYQSAYNSYVQNQTEKAIINFTDYLKQFPEGFFATKAHFFRGELFFSKKAYDDALPDYNYVTEHSKSDYLERCFKNVSFIYYNKKEYASALPMYVKLEQFAESKENKLYAFLGQMRCSWITKEDALCLKASETVLTTDVVTAEQKLEAHYYLMKLSFAKNDFEITQKNIKAVLAGPRNHFSAEAKYLQTDIMFQIGDRKNLKKQVNELSDKYGEDFPFWEAKGYILLAKNYALVGDTVQARFTLQSILDNFEPASDDPESIPELVQSELQKITPKKQEEPVPMEENLIEEEKE